MGRRERNHNQGSNHERGRDKNQDQPDLTELLADVSLGKAAAKKELVEHVYTELHRMARGAWRSTPPGHTLQPTALVHEVYFKLFGKEEIGWDNRAHFFAAASRAMRDVLVDQARRHGALKRGGDRKKVPLLDDHASLDVSRQAEEVLSLNDALSKLEIEYPEAAMCVMFHVFGGFHHADIAKLQGCSDSTVRRRWAFAKSWLKESIESEDRNDEKVDDS